MDDLTALRRARDLISDPARWTQGVFARDADGDEIGPRSPKATCWCSIGALEKVKRSFYLPLSLLGSLSSGVDISVVNDNSTHAEVLAMFDAAIARESAR